MWLPVQLPIDLTLASTTPAAAMPLCVTVGLQSVDGSTMIIQGVTLNGVTVVDQLQPVIANLVLYYDPSNTASYSGTGTVINSLASPNLAGTMSNITYTDPYFAYNGTSSQVSVADTAALEPGAGDWTMEVWVNQTVNTGSQVILGKFDPGGGANDVSYAIRVLGGNVRADFGNGSTAMNTSNYSLSSSTWYQLTYVFNNVANNNVITYVNGVQQATTTHSFASILNTSANLYNLNGD